MKRGLLIADLHCGNIGGLVHPDFYHEEHRENQEAFWDWFSAAVKKWGPFDFLIADGDLTDGEGKKGTMDTIMPNVNNQIKCATRIIESLNIPADKIFLVRGTPFHTNGVLEYEDAIAAALDCSIKSTQKIKVDGVNIHSRHIVGRSDTAYCQATPLSKELTRLEMQAFKYDCEAPDVIVRAHVHYEQSITRHGRLAIDLPCLELPIGEANGRRYSSFDYDVGFGVLDIYEDRAPIYTPEIMPIALYHDEEYQCVKW